ncbi:glycoside hydrolase family 5 protein [Methylobacterium haplocladii]|nr:cellulase family glycosylhydrolase [Methylobacterium haplocladii]GJD82657.1 hypothetical protein HPGCJGGD_0516 [Methylobacterium haplocladii]
MAYDGATRRGVIGGGLASVLAPRTAAAARTGPEPIAIRRGINLWPWFSLTREFPAPRTDYGWPAFQERRPVPTRSDLSRLARVGFDFVRLPVDPGPFLAFDGAQRAALFADLHSAIAAILAEGLTLVLNLHANAATHHYNPGNLYGEPRAPLLPAYRALVAELARDLTRYSPERVAFEPVNEPTQDCASASWTLVQTDLLAAARVAAPRLTLVATGACGSMIRGLTALDPAPLRLYGPLLYTFHFYEPYLFTHQGAPWMREPVYRSLNAVPWPASTGRLDATLAAVRARMAQDDERPEADKADAYRLTEAKLAEYFAARPDRGFVDRYLGQVRDWSVRNAIPTGQILMGEFGALRSDHRYVASGAADRARYVADVRRSAETYGFPWAFWNLFDGMGIMDDTARELDTDMLGALGLRLPTLGLRP